MEQWNITIENSELKWKLNIFYSEPNQLAGQYIYNWLLYLVSGRVCPDPMKEETYHELHGKIVVIFF